MGNTHHDQVVLNDVLFYFLAERHSATRYHELAPGVATTKGVQATIIGEIEEARVDYVVLRVDRGYVAGRGAGAEDLDHFIRRAFRPLRSFGDYTVWRRAAPPAPKLTG